ncbi:MAG: biotin/lipoyl-binding protein [Firmicutes bacterium]|nr:biotin/lipoyl-binding protein [Bacillota bacterium]
MRRFRVTVDGVEYEVMIEEIASAAAASGAFAPGGSGPERLNTAPAATVAAPKAAPAAPASPAAGSYTKPVASAGGQPAPAAQAAPIDGHAVCAPLPGVVLELKVKVEDQVSEGQVIMILEAMKMENEIVAPAAGKVKEIRAGTGGSVNAGEVLAVIG